MERPKIDYRALLNSIEITNTPALLRVDDTAEWDSINGDRNAVLTVTVVIEGTISVGGISWSERWQFPTDQKFNDVLDVATNALIQSALTHSKPGMERTGRTSIREWLTLGWTERGNEPPTFFAEFTRENKKLRADFAKKEDLLRFKDAVLGRCR